ncbi:MAG: zinc ribbon domain-containing protein [Planctomycetaceae bacterium]|nr:zinc ribbon domain-containing protein [Planctomycetaceae bacterium]
MPTYDYLCDACGHKFEEFQNITAPMLTKCPACKKKKLRRLFGTGAAVVFKGSGFYQTDYRSEGYKKAKENDSSESGKTDTSGSKESSGTSSTTSTESSATTSTGSKSVKSDATPKSRTSKKKD